MVFIQEQLLAIKAQMRRTVMNVSTSYQPRFSIVNKAIPARFPVYLINRILVVVHRNTP